MGKVFFYGFLAVAGWYGYTGVTHTMAEHGWIDASWSEHPESHLQSPVRIGDVSYVSPIVVQPHR